MAHLRPPRPCASCPFSPSSRSCPPCSSWRACQQQPPFCCSSRSGHAQKRSPATDAGCAYADDGERGPYKVHQSQKWRRQRHFGSSRQQGRLRACTTTYFYLLYILFAIALDGRRRLCRGRHPTCCTPQALCAPPAGERELHPRCGSLVVPPEDAQGPSGGLSVPLLQWNNWLPLLSMTRRMPSSVEWKVSSGEVREGAMRGWESGGKAVAAAAAAVAGTTEAGISALLASKLWKRGFCMRKLQLLC